MNAARCRQGFVIAGSFVLFAASGCVQQQVKRVNEVPINTAQTDVPESQLLDIVVVSFDPGVPKTIEEQKKQKVYLSVRQAEANYFPQVLRQTLDGTGYWGSVRVLPEVVPGADVTVSGKILQSDGEKLKLQIAAVDSTGRKWLDKVYESTAAEIAYTEKLPAGTDPFQDLYNRAANDILAERRKFNDAQTRDIQRIADLRFASDLAPDRFKEYLVKDKSGRYVVSRLPPAGDPYMQKVDQIRQRDDLLVDTLDAHYAVYRQSLEPTYQEWRKSNYQETVALRELETQSIQRKVAGVLGIVGGIVAIGTAGNRDDEDDANMQGAAGTVMIAGGIAVLGSGISKGKEADVHAEALKELNQSIETDVQPRVVELEGKTVTLTGSAKEQYDQWRKLLHERYASETGSGS